MGEVGEGEQEAVVVEGDERVFNISSCVVFFSTFSKTKIQRYDKFTEVVVYFKTEPCAWKQEPFTGKLPNIQDNLIKRKKEKNPR